MRTMTRSIALLLALAGAPPLAAQNAASGPIFVAVPEAFPDLDARAVVIREPGRSILVLRPDGLEPEALAAALRVLRQVAQKPLEPGRGQMIPITGFVLPDLGDVDRRRLAGVLGQLSRMPLSNVGNLGRGRWIRYTEG